MVTIQKIEIYEGDSDSLGLVIGTGDTDITDYTIYLTVKASIDDDDSSAVIKKSITDHISPLTGSTIIPILPEDTRGHAGKGNYVYDIRYDDGTGTISTILKGAFKIVQAVGDLD